MIYKTDSEEKNECLLMGQINAWYAFTLANHQTLADHKKIDDT